MILSKLLGFLATFLAIFGLATAEVFTAMVDMESLLNAEKLVVGVIDQYIDAELRRLKKLKEVAQEYKEKNKVALKEKSNYLANPVNAYLIIKRLTTNWEDLESLMRYNTAENFIRNITVQRGETGVKFPGEEDLKGAGTALLRLQDTYDLDATEIADGKILGKQSANPLRAVDCFELGRIAYLQRDYYHTLTWMQEALRKLEAGDETGDEAEILEHLAFASFHQGNVRHALQLTRRLYQIAPNHPRAKGNVKYYEDALRNNGEPVDGEVPPVKNIRPDKDTDINESREMKQYEKLCRGEYIEITPKEEAKLKCYLKKDRPFLKVGPIKYEVVHLKPKIILFKNILSDYEIGVIKSLAAPKLKRATVKGQDGNLITVNYRIAKSAWLKGEDHPVIDRINQRLDLMTNLNQETAELLQIANYGLGGHYEPHFDMSTRGEVDPYFDGTGNRIATVLFYMSQPEAGGSTVYTRLRYGVAPSMYDAVFWYNIKKSGDGDMSTRHAACPVLSGQKWVANKWIHERGQEFRRPCGLSRDEYE